MNTKIDYEFEYNKFLDDLDHDTFMNFFLHISNSYACSMKEITTWIRCFNEEKETLWFRGHSNSEWLLISNADRKNLIVGEYDDRGSLHLVSPTAIDSIKSDSWKKTKFYRSWRFYYDEFEKRIKDDAELSSLSIYRKLARGQHYGLKTPLLDWTSDGVIALYFATSDSYKTDNDCALYVLKPRKLNKILHNEEVIFSIDTIEQSILDPFAAKGDDFDPRITRQTGNFVIFGDNFLPLDLFDKAEQFLLKIIIPNEFARKILDSLKLLGYKDENVLLNGDNKMSLLCNDANKKAEKSLKNKIERLDFKKINKQTAYHILNTSGKSIPQSSAGLHNKKNDNRRKK